MPRIASCTFALVLAATSAFAEPSEGKQLWQFETGAASGGITPAVGDGRVFVTTGLGGNRIFALNADTGKKLWQHDFNDSGPWSPVFAAGRVITTTESCSIYSQEARTGRMVWSKFISNAVFSFTAADEERVYAVAEQGGWSLVCFKGRNGSVEWKRNVGCEAIGAPVVSDGVVYLSTRDGVVHAIDAARGKVVWKQERGATSPPVVSHGRVLLASEEGGFHLMSLEAADGAPAWQYTASRNPRLGSDAETRLAAPDPTVAVASTINQCDGSSRPCVIGEDAFVGTSDGRLLCLDTTNGKRKWEAVLAGGAQGAEAPVASPVVAGGRVYVGTMRGTFQSLSIEDGKELWSYKASGGFNSAPAVTGGRVYAVSTDGVVHCIDAGTPDAEGWPMWGGTSTHTGPAAAK